MKGRVRATLLASAVTLVSAVTLASGVLSACGNSPPPTAPRVIADAGADGYVTDSNDAGGATDSGPTDASPPLAPAPNVDATPPGGFQKESAAALAPLDGEKKVAIAFAADGCVRVAFAAGAPIAVSLGAARVDARASGLVGERGPVCERAGKTLDLTFRGNANVNYEIWRSSPR